jgi:hypothetical protein
VLLNELDPQCVVVFVPDPEQHDESEDPEQAAERLSLQPSFFGR